MHSNFNRIKLKIKQYDTLFKVFKILYTPIGLIESRRENKRIQQDISLYRQIAKLAQKGNMSIWVSPDKIIITVKDGRKFYLELSTKNSLLDISYRGDFEPEETRLITNILSEGDCVFDIGANFGWYSTLFLQLIGKSGRVYSFEPVPFTFNELKANIELNGYSNRITLNNYALGEKNCDLVMYVPDKLGSAWASLSRHGQNKCTEYKCKMIVLDEYIAANDIKNIKFIKCDVEGAELQVLKGAKRLLENEDAPMWLLEVSEKMCSDFGYSPKELFEYMLGFGYKIYEIIEGKLIPLRSFKNLQTYNFFFVKPGKEMDLIRDMIL